MRNLLFVFCLCVVGCNPLVSGPTNLHEVAMSTLSVVDALEDVADLPKIPDTLKDYKAQAPTKAVEILPPPKVEPKPQPKPEPTPAPAKPVEKPQPKEATPPAGVITKKPVVYCYSGEACQPCKQAKEWYAAADKSSLPFTIEFRSDHHPDWVTFVPVFHWEYQGRWYQTTGFTSGEQLIGTWKKSGQPIQIVEPPIAQTQGFTGGCSSGACGGGRRR